MWVFSFLATPLIVEPVLEAGVLHLDARRRRKFNILRHRRFPESEHNAIITGPCWLLKLRWIRTQRVQIKGVLPYLVRWARRAGTRDFCSALAALVGPEAEFLDEIQTKFLIVFLLVIHSHLRSFALRFIFLQTHATSPVSTVHTVHCEGERRETL